MYKFSAVSSILEASLIVQLTLLSLLLMSAACWAIIFTKHQMFQKIQITNSRFSEMFWKAKSLDEIFSQIKNYSTSPLARIFSAAYSELNRMAESNARKATAEAGTASPLFASGIDNLERAIRKAIDQELLALESKNTWLATTGSTGPFIGLFGTVWGIMGSFHKIGAAQSASLAIVAPGISEALIATAIGLATAIPATVAFNHFNHRLRKEELELNNFSADLLNIIKLNFFREK